MSVKASANITVFNVEDGTNGTMLYGVCSSSGITRTVEIDGVTSYYDGLAIAVKFTVTTSGSMTLNVNSLGAKTVYFNNTSTGGYCPAGYMVILVYETSSKSDGCWKAAYSYNSDTYDRTRYNAMVKASSAIVAGNTIVGNSNGYFHLKTGAEFDIAYPILYAGSSISSGSTGSNNYTEISYSITTTQSITLTAYEPVYIKGTLSGSTFIPVSATPLTQDVPTSEDGYYYILLACAYSTTNVRLYAEHKIYKYFGGAFQVWNYAQTTAEDAAKTATNYLYYDSTVLSIGYKENNEWAGSYAQITGDAYRILASDGTELASFGTSITLPAGTITLGDTTSYNTYISSSGINLRYGTSALASITSNAITLGNSSDTSHPYNTYITSSGVSIRSGTTALTTINSTSVTIGKSSGFNTYIDSDSVDIRSGTTVLASFGASTVYLGKNSTTSTINLCNDTGSIYGLTSMGLGGKDALYFKSEGTIYLDASNGIDIEGGDTYGIMLNGDVGGIDSLKADHASISTYMNVGTSLTVNGAATLYGSVELFGSTPYIDFHYANSTADYSARLICDGDDNLSFYGTHVTINTAHLYVSSGNIFVQDTSASYTRRIYVANSQNDVELRIASNAGVYHDGSTGYSTGGYLIYIDRNGTITTKTKSDRRFKNYLGDVSENEATALLEHITPINFTYKGDDIEVGNGFFAQDVLQVLKDYNIGYRSYLRISKQVTDSGGEKDEIDIFDLNHNEDEVIYGLDYSKFVPVLWKGWQIHKSEIDVLKEQNEQLRVQIEDLALEIAKLKQEVA